MTATKMRGAVFADIGELTVMERDVPVLERQNEVILDVQACGICGTDLHILADPPGQPATLVSCLATRSSAWYPKLARM